MCGIVGYIGERMAVPILLNGLRRLEYRGYDSSGVAFYEDGQIILKKTVGKLSNLENVLNGRVYTSHVGIGHTRWATHGRPSEVNAHPHATERVAVVHNGIIENFRELRERLIDDGVRFDSETDTEVVAHLVNRELARGKTPAEAVKATLKQLRGAF